MDPQIEALRRDVRMLKRALLASGAAIVALAGAHVVANRAPSELEIGQVKIEETGITIRDPETAGVVRLNGHDIHIASPHRGGLLMKPGEVELNDHQRAHMIRLWTWSEIGDGLAMFEVGSGGHGRHDQPTGFRAVSYRDQASTSVFSPAGDPIEFRSAPPRE